MKPYASKYVHLCCAAGLALFAGSPALSPPGSAHATTSALAGSLVRQDLEIVDCLLPGQVRQLGTRATYLSPQRPVRTSASDCRIRGGEYVAFDRANLRSALAVWLNAAEAGDAEAQTNVGEIYERGVGAAPDYRMAAQWYQKAADQGFGRALFNLATLYEQGQGVPQDKLKALNLYRQAWGLPEDSLMYQSAAAQQREALRMELQKQLEEKDAQIGVLQRQLQQLEQEVAKPPPAAKITDAAAEIQILQKLLDKLEAERRINATRLAGILKLRTPQQAGIASSRMMPVAQTRQAEGLDFGRYYALVIGNQNYQFIDSLETPLNDVQRAAKVLADKYGFVVNVMSDASDVAMLKALNDLGARLRPNDNVLIYYAGHGFRARNGRVESGYWLPINADAPPQDTFWVPNEQITAHVARLPARRVLVVSDSCYAGLLSNDPSYLFVDEKVGYSGEYIRFKLPKRSRLLLTSGGDRPVMDSGGGGNSVFARAFLEELETNAEVLPVPELFARMRSRVEDLAARNTFVQTPELKSIKSAGHELGDFFFVPRTELKTAARTR